MVEITLRRDYLFSTSTQLYFNQLCLVVLSTEKPIKKTIDIFKLNAKIHRSIICKFKQEYFVPLFSQKVVNLLFTLRKMNFTDFNTEHCFICLTNNMEDNKSTHGTAFRVQLELPDDGVSVCYSSDLALFWRWVANVFLTLFQPTTCSAIKFNTKFDC